MRISSRQGGFAHIVTVLVVVLVFATVGYIGFKLYANPANDNKATETSSAVRRNTTSLNVPSAPEIKTASDLDKATATLNKVDPGSASKSDADSLNSELSGL